MTEKEKMIRGDWYVSLGEELFNDRQNASEIIFEYNSLHPREVEKRMDLLRSLFGESPKEFYIEQPFRCTYGYNIHWGENSYANFNCTILDCGRVTIGNNVMIGPNVNIFTANHALSINERMEGLEYADTIEIEDGVWIGGGTTINPWVRIGKNSVIGSGTVVTKNIPENVLAVGNPCRVIRKLDKE